MVELNKDGVHTTDALVNAVEKMSAEDWQLIRPVDGKQSDYMTQLKATIATFATPAEQTRLFGMLDGRSAAESFAKASEVKRTFADEIADLAGDEPGTRKAIARAVLAMTEEDVKAYLNDPATRARIDAVVYPDVATFKSSDNNASTEDRAAMLLAQTLLTQAAADGKAPVVEGNPIAATAKAMMEGTNLGESQSEMKARMQSLYTLMSDPATMAKLKATAELLNTPDESKISSADLALYAAMEKLDPSGEAFQQMLQTGKIDIGTQVRYGGRLETGSIYSQHLLLSPERQERVESHLSDDQKQIIDYVREQGGRTDLVDEFRSYVIGVSSPPEGDNGVQDYRYFVDKLRAMSPDQRTALFADYDRKYDGNALEEFKSALEKKDTPTGGYEVVVGEAD